jgi:hypothetical protein
MAKNETNQEKIGLSLNQIVLFIAIVSGLIAILGKLPIFIIKNKLALPIIITINDSRTERIEAKSTQIINLYSISEFPVNVKWKVARNKNNNGDSLGEEIGYQYEHVDNVTLLTINNKIELTTYFYPVIINNTDSKCDIILNDGLSIEYKIGTSSPHAKTNITGYYKYAANTNITLKCGDIVYFYGERNGKQGSPIGVGIGSGVVNLSIPLESK